MELAGILGSDAGQYCPSSEFSVLSPELETIRSTFAV